MLFLRHRADFPALISYARFVRQMPVLAVPLCAYLQTSYGQHTGITFIDSTAVAICGNKRIRRNRVFRGIAKLGKTTMGWFFGFKLHLVINECGELLAVQLSLLFAHLCQSPCVRGLLLARELHWRFRVDRSRIIVRSTNALAAASPRWSLSETVAAAGEPSRQDASHPRIPEPKRLVMVGDLVIARHNMGQRFAHPPAVGMAT
jgi:hypothetical protein